MNVRCALNVGGRGFVSSIGRSWDAALVCVLAATVGCAERTYDNPVDPKVPLQAVSSVNLTILGDTAITVTWEYGGPGEAGFEIEKQTGGGSFGSLESGPPGVHTYLDRFPLVVGETYVYRVRASLSDNRSDFVESPAQQFSFVAPAGLQVVARADTAVMLQWTYAGASQTGFEIERRKGGGGFVVAGTAGPAARQFLDRVAIVLGSEPTYRVRAVASVARSAYTSEQTVAVSFPPPTAGTVTVEGDTAVVSWSHPASFQTGFEVYRQVGGAPFTLASVVGPAVRQYRDSIPLVDGNSYVYRVRAVSTNNQSTFVETAAFAASLAAPTALRIIALTPVEVRLQWQDNSTIETAFELEESLDGSNFVSIATVPGNSLRVTVARSYTPAPHPYYFRARARSTRATGEYSTIVSKPGFVVGMVFVEGGTFQMGSLTGAANEQPVHAVTISSFYIDPREVSVLEYRQFCSATGWPFPPAPSWGWNDTDPMVFVSYDDAGAFARWSGKKLPTEAEWEFAARGGVLSQGFTFSGSNDINGVGWYFGNSTSSPHQIGTKLPNELGIFDMTGNVYEWCADWYGDQYYATSPSVDPQGPTTGVNRVIRGGAWDTGGAYCRVTYRGLNGPAGTYSNTGFRCMVNQ